LASEVLPGHSAQQIGRPSGTFEKGADHHPSVETLGYFRTSLRDACCWG
jgi:hypothetical protein